MKYVVTISMTLDDIEAEDEDEACIIAAQMFDFGSADFEWEVEEDIVYLEDIDNDVDK